MSNCKLCWTSTSTLTYNIWNTAATDIKYVLVESYGTAECIKIFESIKFYDHVGVLLKFKFLM